MSRDQKQHGVLLDWEAASRITLADLSDQYRLVTEEVAEFNTRVANGEEITEAEKVDFANYSKILIHLKPVIEYYGGTV